MNLRNSIKSNAIAEIKPIIKYEFKEYKKEFEEVWKLYPKKKGKQHACTAFRKLVREHSIEEIKRAISRYTEVVKDTDLKFIKMGSSFFQNAIYDYFDDNYKLIIEDEHKKVIPETKVEIDIDSLDGYGKLIHYLKSMPYDKYLETEHWKHFRNEALKWAGHKCQLCNKEDTTLVIHHKTYENRGRETFNDVIVLCENCHKLIHGK